MVDPAPGAIVKIEGLDQVKAAFWKLGPEATKELRNAYRKIARTVAERSRSAAARGTPLQVASARSISGQATAGRAKISITPTKGRPAALVAFWGTNKRTGWFAAPKYGKYTARTQHLPAWVGADWGPAWQRGDFTEGPYALRDAMRESVPTIETDLQAAILEAARRVGLEVR